MMPRLHILILTLPASLLLIAMVTACAGDNGPASPAPAATAVLSTQPADTPVPAPTATSELANASVPTLPPDATPVPTRIPTATQAPAPASTPAGELTSAEIYAMLSPSVAYIETPTGTGSGFLADGGYVVTNHHVVWPFEEARVAFPDGTEMTAPVAAWDPMSDMAVLGPVEVEAPPLELRDGENLAVGSELFLLGYPGELEPFPEPTIVSGVLSRYRRWDQAGMTYLQTDAAIAGGQSGGVLVTRAGEVIGVSGLTITEAAYALAASAADLAPVIQQLIGGQDPWGIGNRRLVGDEAGSEFSASLRNRWDSAMYLLAPGSTGAIEVDIDCRVPATFYVADRWGEVLLDVDNGLGGTAKGGVEVPPDGHHFLIVETSLQGRAEIDLRSSADAHPFHDPDDGRRLGLQETVAGNIDYPGDRDWYSLDLEEGDTVRVSADSLNVDLVLYIDFPGSYADQVAYDDDSGGGALQANPQIVYRAPQTATYAIAVEGYDSSAAGGYFLSVERAPSNADAYAVPPPSPEVDTHLGKMVVLRGPLTGFSIQAPADWTQARTYDEDPDIIFRAVAPRREGIILVQEFDLSSTDEEQSLEEFLVALREEFSERGIVALHEETSFTPSGEPRAVLKFQIDDELPGRQLLIGLRDERYLLMAQYSVEDMESLGDLVDYSFGTLESSGTPKSQNLGKYFRGRTLHVSLVSLERLPELRYSTVDPNGVVRPWTLFPSDADNELILARLKVENHTFDSVTVNVHSSAAELRDHADRPHNPVAIAEAVWQDFHGESEALVRVDQGDCFDGTRALIEPGTKVRWQSEADTSQYLAFEVTSVAVGPEGRAELAPGESVSYTFEEPGIYKYVCGSQYGRERSGVVRVMPDADRASVAERSVLFLDGYFELQKGHGVDGYLVFEVPVDTRLQGLRWLAGDSINIPL